MKEKYAQTVQNEDNKADKSLLKRVRKALREDGMIQKGSTLVLRGSNTINGKVTEHILKELLKDLPYTLIKSVEESNKEHTNSAQSRWISPECADEIGINFWEHVAKGVRGKKAESEVKESASLVSATCKKKEEVCKEEVCKNNKIIRPLKALTQEEINEYAQRHGLVKNKTTNKKTVDTKTDEEKSNLEEKSLFFSLIEKMQEKYPGLTTSLRKNAEIFSDFEEKKRVENKKTK